MLKTKKVTKVNEFENAELAVDLDRPYLEHLVMYFDNGKEKIHTYCLN